MIDTLSFGLAGEQVDVEAPVRKRWFDSFESDGFVSMDAELFPLGARNWDSNVDLKGKERREGWLVN